MRSAFSPKWGSSNQIRHGVFEVAFIDPAVVRPFVNGLAVAHRLGAQTHVQRTFDGADSPRMSQVVDLKPWWEEFVFCFGEGLPIAAMSP